MALLSFFGNFPSESFIGRRRKFEVESPDEVLLFDLLLDESHSMPIEVTKYNIEDGSDITENIRLPLRTGSVTGFVTSLSANRETSTSNPFAPPNNTPQIEYDSLIRMRDERKPVTIITNLEIYEEVLMTNISTSRSSSDGESQAFSISFTKSNIVKLQAVAIDLTVKIPDTKSNSNRQASKKLNVGRR